MKNYTIEIIRRVNAAYSAEIIKSAIKAMGYMGDGSMDDAGCVELAYMKLDREHNIGLASDTKVNEAERS